MKNFLQSVFLLITFIMVPGSYIHADAMENYDYDTVSQQKQTAQDSFSGNVAQLELIKNNRDYVLTIASLFTFTLIIITILMWMTPHKAKDLVTIIGLVSVIFGTILLVLVVDTSEALTAPMGILGAIAGYLFGSAQKKDVSDE